MARVPRQPRRPQRLINPILRYILFTVNFIFWLLGFAVTIIAAYALWQKEKDVTDAIDFFLDPACVICLAGSITIVLTYCGYVGPLRLNRTMLKMYYWPLGVFLFLETALAIFLFITYAAPEAIQKMKIFPEDALSEAIVRYQSDDDIVDLINGMQRSLSCCGMSNDDQGYKDWNMNMYFNCTESNRSPLKCSVPPSCCVLNPNDPINLLCGKDALSQSSESLSETINVNGCFKAVGIWIEGHAAVFGGCLAGILVPQMILIWMAKGLALDILEETREANHRRLREEIKAAVTNQHGHADQNKF